MSGEKGEPFRKVLESANSIMENIVKIIMYYAPIGLGCYMASFIGSIWYINSGRIFKNIFSIFSNCNIILFYNV